MPIEYIIDTEKKIVFETWSEYTTIEEYVEAKRNVFSDPEFKIGFNFLTDIRNNKQDYDENLISKIIKFLEKNITISEKVKSAVVADDPGSVIKSIIFENMGADLILNIKVFSTIEAALEWLSY